ncbi:MAG: ATP-binding protein [Candidatus Polarisedimenticolia bacterium]|nr:PAS domain S-box protein [bacterium]
MASRPGRFALLALLAVATALGLFSAQRTWREETARPGMGLVETTPGDVVVASLDPGGAAQRAGFKAGDLLVEIGGHPVHSRLVGLDLLAQAQPDRPVGVVVLRQGTTTPLALRVVAERTWAWDRVVGSLVAALFLLAAAAAALRPRQGGPALVYAAWCLAGALLLGVSWSARGERIDWLLFWVDRAARLALPALFVHLAFAARRAPGGRWRRWLPLAYAPAAALLLAEIHLAGLGGALRALDPVAALETLRGRIEMTWLAAGFAWGVAILARAAAKADNAEDRARARWFLVGSAAGLAPFLAVTAIPGIAGGATGDTGWISLPFLVLVPLTFTAAALDYRLMDLAFFLRRGLVVGVTLAFSLVLFLGFQSLAATFFPALLHPAGVVPALIALAVTAALAPAIRAGARDVVGRLFYRRRYNVRLALARLARDLNAERELPRLAETLERRIVDALGAGVVRLLLAGPEGELLSPYDRLPSPDGLTSAMRAALMRGEILTFAMLGEAPRRLPALNALGVQWLVPLRVENDLVAVLAAGPARGRALLDSDDLDLLRSVAGHAAAAVAGALHLADLRGQVQLVQRLQAQTESLINNSPIGMAVIDLEGVVRQWNPAVEALLGTGRRDALGRRYTDVLPLALRSVTREFLRQAPSVERSRAYRIRIGGAEDEKLVDLAINVLRGPEGWEGTLLSLDDVTERVRLEDQLIQQDRLASVGLLAAGVAHEVNTPLTGISSYAQMLLEECPGDDPRRPMLEKIVQQAGRASHIARGLLRFSRPGPTTELSIGPVDFREMMEETIGLLGPQVRRAKAKVSTEWSGAPVVAMGDRSRLQQVGMNLLLNAVDAVGEGGHVVVRTGVDGEAAWFEVRDDGVGIPEELRNRIFDPFFTTKKPGQGTGLGLSISYSIVREHGGALAVESEPGRGTTMRVSLPAVATARAEEIPAPRRAAV